MKVTWDVDPMDFADSIGESVAAVTNKVAEKVFENAVGLTPVFTGRLRDSWRLSVNQPDKSYTSKGGSEGSPLPTPSTPTSTAKGFERVIVSNASPYATTVENGGPHNTPRSMAALAVRSLQ